MRKALIVVGLVLIGFIIGFLTKSFWPTKSVTSIIPPKLRPLEKYSIENLSSTNVTPTKIELGKTIKDDKDFTSKSFSFNFDPTLQNKTTKKVTGLINLPKEATDSANLDTKKYPLVLMIRGFVDKSIYYPGQGTQHAGEFFAKNGFITIAPDFLGYAGSDTEAENVFEARFQTYTTVMTLLKSLDSLNEWDGKNLFIWGHSNGGQIALTTLEITQTQAPTVLWAPVSKPFPYSILYYTDDSIDFGKDLRAKLSGFEADYDVDKYSLTNYIDRIEAPIELHQGTADTAVPVLWSDSLNKALKAGKKDITYFKYPGADHNLTPGWDLAVARSLDFYIKNLKK